jgi:hypothetical protein
LRINQLRQLIDLAAAQESTDRGGAARRNFMRWQVRGSRMHGAQLVAGERHFAPDDTGLAEDGRTFRAHPDQDHAHGYDRRQHRQQDSGEHGIECKLDLGDFGCFRV